MNENALRKIRLCFIMPCLVVLSLVVFFMLTANGQQAISALLAGGAVILPSLVFVSKLFQYSGAQNAKHIVNGFYLGEAYKLCLTACIVSIIFYGYAAVDAQAFFSAYVVTIISQIVASLIYVR